MPKTLGLIDVDSKIPNLALMKVSAFYKTKGYAAEFYTPFKTYDLTYASKVFSYTQDYDYYPADGTVKGGTGYITNDTVLPDEIEHTCPDYSLYEIDYSMGFITRGCIRTCNFCIVPKKEGFIRPNADIDEFVRHKNVVCLDNNILASDFGLKQIEKIISRKLKVDFNQGLDARIIAENPEIAKLLSRVKWLKPVRMAMDNMGEAEAVIKATELLRKYNTTPKRYFVYLLVKSDIKDAYERANLCKKYELNPFAQSYLDPKLRYKNITKEQINFCKWVNVKIFFKQVDYYDFKDTRTSKLYESLKGEAELCF
jgi:hypothetical protein